MKKAQINGVILCTAPFRFADKMTSRRLLFDNRRGPIWGLRLSSCRKTRIELVCDTCLSDSSRGL